MDERVAPHNLDAERIVLGAVMVDRSLWSAVAARVTAAEFYRDAHAKTFSALQALVEAGAPLELVALVDRLRQGGILDEVGGPAYIAALVDGIPSATNAPYYADLVREKAQLRRIIEAGSRMIAEAYAAEETSARVAERGVQAIHQTVRAAGGTLFSGGQAMRIYVDSIDGSAGAPVPSGLTDLDAVLGKGFKPGTMNIIAARPGMGKTALGVRICDHVAETIGPAGFFSIEMTAGGIGSRLLSARAHVSTHRLESDEATESEWARVAEALEHPLERFVVEESSRTVAEIEAWCERIERERGKLAILAIDYIQLMMSARRRDNDESEIREVSAGLTGLAKRLRVPILALSQLSRAPEGRKDKRPLLADLRGSGALEQDAYSAILIYRDEQYGQTEENHGIAELIVAKHRNGPTGTVRVNWSGALATFRDLAPGP